MVFMYLCEFFKVYIFGEMVNVFCVPPNRTVISYILPVLLKRPGEFKVCERIQGRDMKYGLVPILSEYLDGAIIEFIKK